MMLYHLNGRDTFVIPNWTEIYVIITVSTMFCEEVRKVKIFEKILYIYIVFVIYSFILNMIHVWLNDGVQLDLLL